jgi:hypothetical protein
MKRSNTEVICLKSDVRLFLRAGFTLSTKAAGPGRVRLAHNDPNRAFELLIELMVTKHAPFTARIGRTAYWGVRRLAFAGHDLVVLGVPVPQRHELRRDRRVRAAFRRLASSSEVR